MEKAIFTNMCMITDGDEILVQFIKDDPLSEFYHYHNNRSWKHRLR